MPHIPVVPEKLTTPYRDGDMDVDVVVEWDWLDGRPEPMAITITHPDGEPRPITTADLRIPLKRILKRQRMNLDFFNSFVAAASKEQAEFTVLPLPASPRSPRGRPRVPFSEYELAARVAREAWRRGENRKLAIADELQISERTAASRLRGARDHGLDVGGP